MLQAAKSTAVAAVTVAAVSPKIWVLSGLVHRRHRAPKRSRDATEADRLSGGAAGGWARGTGGNLRLKWGTLGAN
eukprot:scaffold83089_cov75-Phaeocystis_antarctica.AAC.1